MNKNLLGLVLLLVIIFLSFLWWHRGISPVDKARNDKRIFVIEKGEGIRSIAKRLKEEGFIKDQIVFFVLVKRGGLEGKIQAGDFRLSPSMNAREVALELTHGTLDVWVTIPEGLRSEEIGQVLKDKIPTYEDSWAKQLAKNEGYLFPDTYLIPKDSDIDLVIKIMRSNFNKKWEEIKTSKDMEEVIILASIIEREAKFSQDRPIVAGILARRLALSIPLQADATVQYAIGSPPNWWKIPTPENLKIKSPFNTYLNYGPPPSPISNPGLDSIKAAANPVKTNYLYYLSDKDGRMHYAENLEEHNKNIEKYL